MFKFLNNPSNLSKNSNAEIRASSSPSVHKSFLARRETLPISPSAWMAIEANRVEGHLQ